LISVEIEQAGELKNVSLSAGESGKEKRIERGKSQRNVGYSYLQEEGAEEKVKTEPR